MFDKKVFFSGEGLAAHLRPASYLSNLDAACAALHRTEAMRRADVALPKLDLRRVPDPPKPLPLLRRGKCAFCGREGYNFEDDQGRLVCSSFLCQFKAK